MTKLSTFVVLLLLSLSWRSTLVNSFLENNRIKGEDEPNMVSYRVLEGIIEPFELSDKHDVPAWKSMKDMADLKAANMQLQSALESYSQLLKHPYMFGDMPLHDRYDVFVSMAKILKKMGFHQRAELLLYEAMSYTTIPYEAHLQLGILAMDKEDLQEAKMHFKNCLYHKENDLVLLTHLSLVLIVEGKSYEAKFFLSRLLSALEVKVKQMLLEEGRDVKELVQLTARIEESTLARWLEALMVKVLHGEFLITSASTFEFIRMFSNLYTFISDGQLVGRAVFDIGQSLYEGGRPFIGLTMMMRGKNTSNAEIEGFTSFEVVKRRLALDFPSVPKNIEDMLDRYMMITRSLKEMSESRMNGTHHADIDIENMLDLYWPIPLLGWSGLPTTQLVAEFVNSFSGVSTRQDAFGKNFLYSVPKIMQKEDEFLIKSFASTVTSVVDQESFSEEGEGEQEKEEEREDIASIEENLEYQRRIAEERAALGPDYADTIDVVFVDGAQEEERRSINRKDKLIRKHKSDRQREVVTRSIPLEVGLFGGHMNRHSVGRMVLHRLLPSVENKHKGNIRLTLLALMLLPDAVTKRIASRVHRVINLPMSKQEAWAVVETLKLDVLLVPDWLPFPDQQSIMMTTARVAPVQICFFVRGGSCVVDSIDYYLMPLELKDLYLVDVPALANGISRDKSHIGNTSTTINDLLSDAEYVQRRPPWLEAYKEQVVLVDWPLLLPQTIMDISTSIISDEARADNRKMVAGKTGDGGAVGNDEEGSAHSRSSNGFITSQPAPLDTTSFTSLGFTPLEVEGQVFFDDQPVAVVPLHPSQFHPLMDATIFKIMQSCSSLHVVLVLPEVYFNYGVDTQHKMAWARMLVRRLWSNGGNLYHRIRLLPQPLNDRRLAHLIRQADMVLDSFPIGNFLSFVSLALSVGTPVVTLRTGTRLYSSREDLMAIQRKYGRFIEISGRGDIPWKPSASTVAGFYERHGLSQLVANNLSEYYTIASTIANERELGYHLRITILDAIDRSLSGAKDINSRDSSAVSQVWSFIESVGVPWAAYRADFLNISAPVKKSTVATENADSTNSARSVGVRRRRGVREETATGDNNSRDNGGGNEKFSGMRRKRRRRSTSNNNPFFDDEFEGGRIITE